MKKTLLVALLLICLTTTAQPSLYYVYKPADSLCIKKTLTVVQPANSTLVAPTMPMKYAKWNGITWINIATPTQIKKDSVPFKVSRRQLKLQLVLSGFNMSSIDSTIESLPEPDKSIFKISWVDSVEFERQNPLILSMATLLGVTEDQLDTIFIEANKL